MDVHALLTCCHAITSPQPQAVLSVVVTCVWSDSEPQHVWAVGNAQASKRLELPQLSWQRSSELVVRERPAPSPRAHSPYTYIIHIPHAVPKTADLYRRLQHGVRRLAGVHGQLFAGARVPHPRVEPAATALPESASVSE